MFYLQTLLESIELAGGGEGLLHVGAHSEHQQVGQQPASDRAEQQGKLCLVPTLLAYKGRF